MLSGDKIEILPSEFAVYKTISNSLDPGVTRISFWKSVFSSIIPLKSCFKILSAFSSRDFLVNNSIVSGTTIG